MKKPKLIKNNEKTLGVFSSMEMGIFTKDLQSFFKDNNIQMVYSETTHKNGLLIWNEVIYKTAQPFYIHVSHLKNDIDKWSMNIYYKPEQLNELLIYTNQLLKQFK